MALDICEECTSIIFVEISLSLAWTDVSSWLESDCAWWVKKNKKRKKNGVSHDICDYKNLN